MMGCEALHCVCVHTGGYLSEEYPKRLVSMVRRNYSGDLRFTCFADRPLELPGWVDVVDVSSWGLKGTHPKLRLFDKTVLDTPHLVLDTTVVVLKPLEPLIEIMQSSSAPLVLQRDWFYDCLNGSVRSCRPSDETDQIWRSYEAGEKFDTAPGKWERHYGEQDFIWGALKKVNLLDEVEWIPEGMVASFKGIRRAKARSAAEQLERAIILKFHGEPKQHQILAPGYTWGCIRRWPFRPWVWGYLKSRVRECWR